VRGCGEELSGEIPIAGDDNSGSIEGKVAVRSGMVTSPSVVPDSQEINAMRPSAKILMDKILPAIARFVGMNLQYILILHDIN
jgi:hypothetical protein